MKIRQRTYALVYQCGLANVFRLNRNIDVPELPAFSGDPARDRTRVLQNAFSPCERFAQGLIEGEHVVLVFHCDKAGDIAGQEWEQGAGEMFADAKHPPTGAHVA